MGGPEIKKKQSETQKLDSLEWRSLTVLVEWKYGWKVDGW